MYCRIFQILFQNLPDRLEQGLWAVKSKIDLIQTEYIYNVRLGLGLQISNDDFLSENDFVVMKALYSDYQKFEHSAHFFCSALLSPAWGSAVSASTTSFTFQGSEDNKQNSKRLCSSNRRNASYTCKTVGISGKPKSEKFPSHWWGRPCSTLYRIRFGCRSYVSIYELLHLRVKISWFFLLYEVDDSNFELSSADFVLDSIHPSSASGCVPWCVLSRNQCGRLPTCSANSFRQVKFFLVFSKVLDWPLRPVCWPQNLQFFPVRSKRLLCF